MYILEAKCTCPMVYCGDQRATSMNWIFAPRLWLCFRTLFLERSKTAHSFQRVNWKQSNVRIPPKFKSVDQQAFVARITGVWWRVTYRKRNTSKLLHQRPIPGEDVSWRLKTWCLLHSLQGAGEVAVSPGKLSYSSPIPGSSSHIGCPSEVFLAYMLR